MVVTVVMEEKARHRPDWEPSWKCWGILIMSKTYYVCKYTPVELLRALGGDCEILNEMPEGFDLDIDSTQMLDAEEETEETDAAADTKKDAAKKEEK